MDIYLTMNLFTDKNSTLNYDDYASTIEYEMRKKSYNYDLFVYDPLNVKRYSPYLEDLRKWLPKEHLDKYDAGDSRKICTYNGEWLALPIFLKYMVLYSNNYYLKKYNITIPKTWDELINKTEYILNEENKLNNNDNLIGYNGLFPDEIFQSDESFNFLALMNKNILFSNFWDPVQDLDYTISLMPGNIDGINGSCMGGYIIGMANYIKEENKKAAAEVLKYISSEDIQKNVIVKKVKTFTGLTTLYDDEEVKMYHHLHEVHRLKVQILQN
ncbi:hypothetical protein PIROE2DRAFT_60550 [Piromyces sp. E2]|nr:hypothetical protein PIROE2DRAFT_60550 [Piromyces sp. E2]|eukprot:OUM64590.1 hypothetical protein PIROE2DRAFT_60550 [Piromyces sp. E2]